MAVPRYHINLNAYLPTGEVDRKGSPLGELHEGPCDIEYAGDPSIRWQPLNDEAVAAQKRALEAVIARRKQALEFTDPKSKERPAHMAGIKALEAQLAALGVETPAAPVPVAHAQQQQQRQGQQQGQQRR